MKLTVSTLCDFAQVRGGLLFVSSGGISRLMLPSLPHPSGLMLALVVELDHVELESPHDVRVDVVDEDGHDLATVTGVFQAQAPDLNVGEQQQIPIALDLRTMPVKSVGAHDVNVYIDGDRKDTRTIWVIEVPPQPTST